MSGSSRLGWSFVTALVVIYTALNVVVRPTMWSDSGFGFLGWDARDALPFNHAAFPDPADISRDAPFFQATWSPGQHLVPGLLELAGVNLGVALVLVTAAFSAAGLVGWYLLYRAFSFSERACLIAVVLVACSRHFAHSFGIYFGGEVMQFGIAPWFFLLVWRLRDLGWTAIPPLLGGALAMFLAKLTGVILAAAAIAAAVTVDGRPWLDMRRLRKATVAGVAVVIMAIVFYIGWYSRGETAVSARSTLDWSILLGQLVFTLSAVWSAALSLGELGAHLFLHPRRPLLDTHLPIYGLFLPFAATTYFLVWRHLRRGHSDYLRFATTIAVLLSAVLLWSWSHGTAVSIEERHLRIPSLLLLIGTVQTIFDLSNRWLRVAAATVASVAVLYGQGSQVQHLLDNADRPLGNRGFRQWIADAGALAFIRTIDHPGADRSSTLILVPSGEIGLEVRHIRVMANHADAVPLSVLANARHNGRVPRLYVLIQRKLVENGKADAVLRSFLDYSPREWRMTELPGAFVVFEGGGAAHGTSR